MGRLLIALAATIAAMWLLISLADTALWAGLALMVASVVASVNVTSVLRELQD